jgi:hypothetical protein
MQESPTWKPYARPRGILAAAHPRQICTHPLPPAGGRLPFVPPPDFCAAVGLATMALGFAQNAEWCGPEIHDRFMLGATDAALAWSVWRGAALNASVLGLGGRRSGAAAAAHAAGPDAEAGAALAAMAWGASGTWLASAVDSQVRSMAPAAAHWLATTTRPLAASLHADPCTEPNPNMQHPAFLSRPHASALCPKSAGPVTAHPAAAQGRYYHAAAQRARRGRWRGPRGPPLMTQAGASQ